MSKVSARKKLRALILVLREIDGDVLYSQAPSVVLTLVVAIGRFRRDAEDSGKG